MKKQTHLNCAQSVFLDKIKGTMIKEKLPQNTGFSPTAGEK
jgi:hypothetical protein